MKVLLIFIGGLLLLGITAILFSLRQNKNQKEEPDAKKPLPSPPPDGECCGQHAICERDSLLAGVSRKIEYYDDEELDRFIGRKPDQYTEQETDEFRDVLYTMQEDDVAGWVRSLQLRQVELPEAVKEEVLLIVRENREHGKPT